MALFRIGHAKIFKKKSEKKSALSISIKGHKRLGNGDKLSTQREIP